MVLTPDVAYQNIVRVPSTERNDLHRIEPGSPDKSYMVKKLRGDPDITGFKMPLEETLTQQQLDLLINWVKRGAPRN
jgi:hypothetical protein